MNEDQGPPSPGRQDPRIARTRAHVLSHARALLAEGGLQQVTYQELSARALVTRQTLYRHWPAREALFADLALESATWEPDEGSIDPEDVIRAFLRASRDGMDDPDNAAPLTALIALADHDTTCQHALNTIVTERRNALNNALAPSGVQLDAEAYAFLLGPLLFQRLLSREPVPDELIDRLVSTWAATRLRSPG